MISYHGAPITPESVAAKFWRDRHAMVSFAYPDEIKTAAMVAESFALDNGAFTEWRNGTSPDWDEYYKWVEEWRFHPGFDFALIPDLIEGSESDNDKLVFSAWPFLGDGVPVWHLHESLDRLKYLAKEFRRVALGSSGQWSRPGTSGWWMRMAHVMDAICDDDGRPKVKLHGLRMLNPQIVKHLPLASADSTNVARNINLDSRWRGFYAPLEKSVRAEVIASCAQCDDPASIWRKVHIQDQLLEAFTP